MWRVEIRVAPDLEREARLAVRRAMAERLIGGDTTVWQEGGGFVTKSLSRPPSDEALNALRSLPGVIDVQLINEHPRR